MTPAELRTQAVAEVEELGPAPADPHDHALWSEERRGAVVLLAALADHEPAKLRGAANLRAQEWESMTVRGLLLDAATECSSR